MENKVAILYQVQTPPERNGIIKLMKPGGYSDSGADIAYSLQQNGVDVITPVKNPKIENDLDWVFPDTAKGIQTAISKGATIIWLNTVLYEDHPIELFIANGLSVVGQIPKNVDLYDDKILINKILNKNNLPIPKSITITNDTKDLNPDFNFPIVVKPIRGRGSQGVSLVYTDADLKKTISEMFTENSFGDSLYIEEFLPGEEVTITIMPPGIYTILNTTIHKTGYWSLPPVRRFNHENGIAPYNGTVAVINNSEVLQEDNLQDEKMQQLCKYCEYAAKIVEAKAPIRIDCRADSKGNYYLFDLNMKPNMTGASRPHRQDQNSLTALASRAIGWSFDDLILNMLNQHWKIPN